MDKKKLFLTLLCGLLGVSCGANAASSESLSVSTKSEDLSKGYAVSFAYDASIFDLWLYRSKNDKTGYLYDGTCVSRDGETGEPVKTGDGQVNFRLEPKKHHYSAKAPIVEGLYKNLKFEENVYRVTKIASPLAITVGTDLQITSSIEPGFYPSGTKLELATTEGAVIHYTADGTTPTAESPVFPKNGLLLSDASKQPNRNSANPNVSYGFDYDITLYSPDQIDDDYRKVIETKYLIPSKPVDKCWPIRAIAIDGKITSSEKNLSYFVGFEEKEGYNDTGFISLTTDPDNLFSHDKGIYVIGVNETPQPGPNPYWMNWSGNYRWRGKESERPVHLAFFDQKKNPILEKDVGARIHGAGSRAYAMKGLNFYARDEYDGRNKFDYDFFHDGYNPQRLTLSTGAEDFASKLSDFLPSSLLQGHNMVLAKSERYCLFINGEFWGHYYLNQKLDDDYFAYYYNVDKDEVIYHKKGVIEEGVEEDQAYVDHILEWLQNMDQSEETVYERTKMMIDLDSAAEYYAFMAYIARRVDWYPFFHNYGAWRVRHYDGGQTTYGDARWRFVVFDLNYFAYENPAVDPFEFTWNHEFVFHALYANPSFQKLFWEKILALSDELSCEDTLHFVEEYANTYRSHAIKEDERFFDGNGYNTADFDNRIRTMKNFLEHRGDTIRALYQKYYVSPEA